MSYLACQFFIFESHVFVLKISCFHSQSLVSPGCKTPSVSVVYTPFTNLKKTPDMEVGQVGFHDRKKVSLHDNKRRRERERKRCHDIWYALSGCMECSVALALLMLSIGRDTIALHAITLHVNHIWRIPCCTEAAA